jgi:amidase
LFAQQIATQGSPYTERLDAAGLVTLGKTTTSELGLLGSTEALLFGVTHNPWSSTKSATGSSGGAAAAVASGMVPLAHASDGGGSIRIPASVCGLFGFKPGRGRSVSNGVPDPFGLLIEHCVSRSVRDSAQMLAVTEASSDHPVGFVAGPSATRLRIGVYRETLLGRSPDPVAAQALAHAVTLCTSLGHECVEVPAPTVDGRAVSDAFFTAAGAGIDGFAKLLQPMLGRELDERDLEPFTLSLLQWYRALAPGALEQAVANMQRASTHMLAFLADHDVALCPTLPIEPPDLGTLAPTLAREQLIARTEVLAGYTAVHNMAGAPAMSVPLSVSAEGLPIGTHFAASPGHEARLLSLAYELEDAVRWSECLPRVSAS